MQKAKIYKGVEKMNNVTFHNIKFRCCYDRRTWNVYISDEKESSHTLKYYPDCDDLVLFKDYEGYKRKYEKQEIIAITPKKDPFFYGLYMTDVEKIVNKLNKMKG